MNVFTVGYFVGSLAEGSLNRKLARARDPDGATRHRFEPCLHRWRSLRHRGFRMKEIPFADSSALQLDYDGDYPPEARAFTEAIASVDAVLFVTPGVQPLHSRRAEERDRLGEPRESCPYGPATGLTIASPWLAAPPAV